MSVEVKTCGKAVFKGVVIGKTALTLRTSPMQGSRSKDCEGGRKCLF